MTPWKRMVAGLLAMAMLSPALALAIEPDAASRPSSAPDDRPLSAPARHWPPLPVPKHQAFPAPHGIRDASGLGRAEAHGSASAAPGRVAYTEAGLRTFLAVFQAGVAEGVENATIRAMNQLHIKPSLPNQTDMHDVRKKERAKLHLESKPRPDSQRRLRDQDVEKETRRKDKDEEERQERRDKERDGNNKRDEKKNGDDDDKERGDDKRDQRKKIDRRRE